MITLNFKLKLPDWHQTFPMKNSFLLYTQKYGFINLQIYFRVNAFVIQLFQHFTSTLPRKGLKIQQKYFAFK